MHSCKTAVFFNYMKTKTNYTEMFAINAMKSILRYLKKYVNFAGCYIKFTQTKLLTWS